MRFLDHAKKIGAFGQIAVIEEPFGERNEVYVGDQGYVLRRMKVHIPWRTPPPGSNRATGPLR